MLLTKKILRGWINSKGKCCQPKRSHKSLTQEDLSALEQALHSLKLLSKKSNSSPILMALRILGFMGRTSILTMSPKLRSIAVVEDTTGKMINTGNCPKMSGMPLTSPSLSKSTLSSGGGFRP